MIVVGLLGMLTAIALPNVIKSRDTSQTTACINNLKEIDSAKQQWALEMGTGLTKTPGADELQPYFGRGSAGTLASVHCPLAGNGPLAGYTVNDVGTLPKCDNFSDVHPAQIE